MANKSISVVVVDVVRVGSLINCVKPRDLKISFNFLVSRLGFLGNNNFFSLSRSIVQAVVKAIHII